MCRECWTRNVDGAPWCDGCVALLEEPTPVVLYAAASVVAAGIAGVAAFKLVDERDVAWIVWGVASALIGATAYRIHRKAESARRERKVVAVPAQAAAPAMTSAYRGHLRRAIRNVSPPISGAAAALVVLLVLALSAGAIPAVLRLSPFVEWELTIGAWWLVWSATFGTLLYRGWRVARDTHALGTIWRQGKGWRVEMPSLEGCNPGDGCSDPQGCVVAIGVVLVAGLALLFAWLMVELVLPVIFVGAYWLVVRGLMRVANDHHGCEGDAFKSVAWGAIWALLYTAPLAALVWLGHLAMR
jgi:uncharacterized membrane protein HdeD (DUF308 family)